MAEPHAGPWRAGNNVVLRDVMGEYVTFRPILSLEGGVAYVPVPERPRGMEQAIAHQRAILALPVMAQRLAECEAMLRAIEGAPNGRHLHVADQAMEALVVAGYESARATARRAVHKEEEA